jgi:hypothetical protein
VVDEGLRLADRSLTGPAQDVGCGIQLILIEKLVVARFGISRANMAISFGV